MNIPSLSKCDAMLQMTRYVPGARNLISGNDGNGIKIEGNTANQVLGNYIGTNIDGSASLGNTERGIEINGGGSSHVIGAATAGAGNLISGNGWDGVLVWFGAHDNVIEGNVIGTDVTGTVDLGNGFNGVNLSDAQCALNWLFGGAAAPGCLSALNINGDDKVNLADPVSLLNFLFGDGAEPPAPYPECGPGELPADAESGCANPPNC